MEELLDAKRFREGFCDYSLFRIPHSETRSALTALKQELNSFTTQRKFLPGYKAVLLTNLDRIVSETTRFVRVDPTLVEEVVMSGRDLIRRVLEADSFEEIAKLGPDFKKKIALPIYKLFASSTQVQVI
jgi:hypothetical protein